MEGANDLAFVSVQDAFAKVMEGILPGIAVRVSALAQHAHEGLIFQFCHQGKPSTTHPPRGRFDLSSQCQLEHANPLVPGCYQQCSLMAQHPSAPGCTGLPQWSEELTQLSGGQRTLVSLGLLLAVCTPLCHLGCTASLCCKEYL